MAFAHSRCTSCAAPRCTPRISRGDSFSAQCRYKPSPNILIKYSGNTSQKVEPKVIRRSVLSLQHKFHPGPGDNPLPRAGFLFHYFPTAMDGK
ncbi:MAG: hypothetical protein GWP07_00270 [Xanthomonadaceae bacterium]|nr:hypothetical protein [Xanthomonadaceae bacterium]